MKRGRIHACTHATGRAGGTGPRNDFTGITPAKSGRYGAAKCDVAIRHSRGLRCPRPTGRPAARPAGPDPSLACARIACVLCTHTRARVMASREPGNTVPWIHCCLIMDQPMLAFALRINTLGARDVRAPPPRGSDRGRYDASFEFRCCWIRQHLIFMIYLSRWRTRERDYHRGVYQVVVFPSV